MRIIKVMEKHDVFIAEDGTIYDPKTGVHYGKKAGKGDAEKRPERKPDKRPKRKKKRSKAGIFATTLISFLAICITIASLYITYNLRGIPDLDLSKRTDYSQASELYDQDGNYLMSYGSAENIEWVSISDVPDSLKNAFVAIEDKRFYSHHGIDIKRTAAHCRRYLGTAYAHIDIRWFYDHAAADQEPVPIQRANL